MKTIHVELLVDVPKVPNFLRVSDGQSVPVCAVSDDGLREMAKQWTKDLLERASEQHLELYGTTRAQGPKES
jgi:hypothetical protein